jgi:hypothetical protein
MGVEDRHAKQYWKSRQEERIRLGKTHCNGVMPMR